MPKAYVPREAARGETRCAATPETVRHLVKAGVEVAVQRGAGARADIHDDDFEAAGAQLVDAPPGGLSLWLGVGPPPRDALAKLAAGTVVVGFLGPFDRAEDMAALRDAGVSALAMEAVPRISRAQKMDALSSQANIGGYKAALLAADRLPRLFPLMMTAAGTIQPAKVVVMGAGVAGLQAIATARRLGGVVEVSDVRPAVKEQVESLGARFIEVPLDEGSEDEGGYAKEQSEEFLRKQRELVRQKVVEADVVITTAAIPGKPAPRLITADMVEDMRDGSVIVDMAAGSGGNCELSVPDEEVTRHGVLVLGYTNMPTLVPTHATEMYARNVWNLLQPMLGEGGELALDLDDEVVAGTLVLHGGKVRHERTRALLGTTNEEGA